MSTVRYGLPISLTPDVLKQGLRYEPRHWKAIKKRLAKKNPTVWEDMNISDGDFYDKLHQRLKDPSDRHEFEEAAKQEQTRRRPLGLCRGLFRHYVGQLEYEESFRDRVPKNASPRELIDAIAYHEDDDRLTNVIWLFQEEGVILDGDLSEILGEHPGVSDRLGSVVDADKTEFDSAAYRWKECLSRVRKALDTSDTNRPELSVVEVLAQCIDELREIAAEAERSADFWSSLATLVREHRNVLSDRTSLKPYVDRVEQHSSSNPVPGDAAELLKTIDDSLRSLTKIVGAIREKSGKMAEVDAEQRSELFREIGDLHGAESKFYSDTEALLCELLPETDSNADTEESVVRLNTSRLREQEGSVVGEPPQVDSEEPESASHWEQVEFSRFHGQPPDKENASADEPPSADDVAKVGSGASTHEVVATEAASEGSTSPKDEVFAEEDSSSEDAGLRVGAGSESKFPIVGSSGGKRATSDSSAEETPHPTALSLSTESDARASDERDSSSSASETLEGMLSTGRFARAYWLTRADHTLGDPDLFGALSEGVRIGPGESCPGALIQFFNGLARKDRWQDDERLLLSASVLGSCLFVEPLPQDIYQLANEFPVESSPVGPLMQRVRELCVYQSAKIRPEDLDVGLVDVTRTARLDDLAGDAEKFLRRVPHIRFQYAPTDFALQFVYRAGSEWHRLHSIVGHCQLNRLSEARALVKVLDPGEVVANLHDVAELTALKQPLDGRARDKLTRHLYDTLGLARDWIRLAAAGKNEGPSRSQTQTQATEILDALEKLLPSARKALTSVEGRGAVDALDSALWDLEARIQGRVPKDHTSIFGDLLLLPGLVLEDDLEPAESHLGDLRGAILEAERSVPEPNEILSECLNRKEYRRARDIIQLHQVGERAHDEYERAVNDERSMLETALRDLELEIEDAFLLGQLRDEAESEESNDGQTRNALERSQLLGVVRDGKRKLNQSGAPEADELRAISLGVKDVSFKVTELASRRCERLRREFAAIMEQLPQTEHGEADRIYLRETFDECIQRNDHVAAFDLLDRGRRAAQDMEAVARATTGSSADLDLFLRRADGYREALGRRDWLAQVEDSIRRGSTFSEIAFGQLDRTRREEASSALRAWNSMTQLRFPSARRQLTESMEELLRFVGLPLQASGVEVADITEAGFAYIRATLTRPVTSSPLPAFGSACADRFEIVVGQTRKEPEQFEEYIRGRRLAGRSVLVFLLLPQSSAYRIRWQRHFVRSRLTVLPLDLVFFLHLCGERNRLPVLFELGLPFTWTRPYITKGENVASEMFVGRRDETANLMDAVGSCIVFGGRQLGKSALLRHVHRENHDPEKSIYVVYLDVDDLGTDSQGHNAMIAVFWRRVYDELLRYNAVPELPQKVVTKDNRLVDVVPNSISTCLFENPEMRIVLLLDETDDLLDCDSSRDFALVRRLRGLMANSERRFKVVFAGLQSVQRYYNWKNHPFAQLGEELVVNPLPPSAAQDLIIRPLRALGFAFENSRLVLRILSQTNYHPGLIQIIGYRLLENLFDKWQRQDTVGPIRPITADDVLGVERDESVMEDIRNRFDWTLDLDDRYKVLTYALVFTPNPTASRFESEFMDIGSDWWPAVFQTMDAQGLRAVLDEMVGLGVLLREHEETVRTYRLRSPNLLRLLGPQDAIEAELLRIIERDQISRPNPRNFHPLVDRKPVAFGPLTNEQVGQLDGYRRPFQLTLITGSEALGLNDVERQFDKLLGEAGEDQRSRAWKKITYVGQTHAEAFVTKLRESLKSRRRTHRFAVVRLGEIEYEGDLSAFFNRLVREMGQICTNESRAHLVLLLDPCDLWRWLRDRNREHVLSQSRVTGLELRRWSDGAIANALDRLDARTASQLAGGKVFDLTSGFHWLVDQGLSRARIRSGANASTLVDEWQTLCGEALTHGGVDTALLALGLRGIDPALESCVWEVLRLRETRNGRPVLTETSFDLAAEALPDSGRQLFDTHIVQIREWMRTMDLVRPLNALNAGEEGSMVLASWVQDVIRASEG